MNKQKMPVLFLGHGSPMNIIAENEFTHALKNLSKELPTPKAILVISAHWMTPGKTCVTSNKKQKTIYDFYGFPKKLYEIKYDAFGESEIAKKIAKKVDEISLSDDWGLDHASWSILHHMYPLGNIPVLELSIDYSPYNGWNNKSLSYHFELARKLSFLRNEGVLIIGSGNIVHNLGEIDFDETAKTYEWAAEFDELIKSKLILVKFSDLLDHEKLDTNFFQAVPTLDHYIPMIYAIGLKEKDEKLTFVYEGFQNASVSMRCFRIG